MLQESKQNRVCVPIQSAMQEQIQYVTCGAESTFCITIQRKVFMWGQGIQIPQQLDLQDIEQIAASKEHWFAWSDTQVFGCGSNKQGKLGMNNSVTTPTLFDIFSEASQYGWQLQKIAVGLDHSVALIEVEDENKIFVWGSNTYQQLGFDASEQFVAIPHQLDLDNLPRIVDIYAQHNYTMAIDEEGRLFSWGSNEFGRLGQNAFAKCMKLPSPITSFGNIKIAKLALGTFHVLAIDTQGNLYSWGRGLQGQLGHGNSNDCSKPNQINSLQSIRDVACGEAHSIALQTNGQIYVFGSGQFGQLGLGDYKQQDTPQILQINGEMIACGRHHSAVLSKNGALYMFGNNEQYQLGLECGKSGAYSTPLPKQSPMNTNQIFELTDEFMNKIEASRSEDLEQLLVEYQQNTSQIPNTQTTIFIKDLMERVIALLKKKK
ncbi:unnamed protein product [Paramecium pentaurelia]|uniref:RCC1-like domain-containing protein n=1 Tax=Paramecium pentaurelia TaxID=43138 RepID=A0A8S1VBV2_9CILI|nr:unnamed protein product [Paramecium pentaurelia]